MARHGFLEHRKFKRLARVLRSRALALGSIELIWSSCFAACDDYLGDADAVEDAADWQGERGALVDALMECGGEGQVGLIEADPVRPGYRVHDLLDHAPDAVKRRFDREAARRAAGITLSDLRRAAGAKGGAVKAPQATDGSEQAVSKRRSFAANLSQEKGREGKGRKKSLAAVKPAAQARGEHDGDETTDGADGSDDTPRADAPDDAARSTAPLKLVATDAPPDRITRDAALARIAAASNGLFVASPASRGGAFKLDRLRALPNAEDLLDRVGRWLGAGGDWRTAKGQRVDGRNIGPDLDAWVAQAKAWDGVSALVASRPAPAVAAPVNRPPPSSSWSPK